VTKLERNKKNEKKKKLIQLEDKLCKLVNQNTYRSFGCE